MRISFDLDDTLICYRAGALHEPPRSRWWPRRWRGEPLRRGAAALLAELAAEHELWVYTTSHRHPQTVWWWLRGYGVRVRYVLNQQRHERAFGRRGRSKHPAAFGIHLHVDDSWGVWLENRFERNVCVVLPGDPDWADTVSGAGGAERAARTPARPARRVPRRLTAARAPFTQFPEVPVPVRRARRW